MTRSLLVLTLALSFSACSIVREVKPLAVTNIKDVCIVENPAVREGFINEYRNTLEQRGYMVEVIAPDSALNQCPLTSTYTANWRWDLALYMVYAKIDVYQGAKPVGSALYDSKKGGANMKKFVDAKEVINGLVTELYPAVPNELGGSE